MIRVLATFALPLILQRYESTINQRRPPHQQTPSQLTFAHRSRLVLTTQWNLGPALSTPRRSGNKNDEDCSHFTTATFLYIEGKKVTSVREFKMKVFMVGGVSVGTSDAKYDEQLRILQKSMERIAKDLVAAGHELLVCSPFPGSADLAAVIGIAEILRNTDSRCVEFHCPDSPEVGRELNRLADSLSLKSFRAYLHPLPTDEHGKSQWTYGWLLAQLSAMDRSQAVVSIGGKLDGSASLLLALAEGQRKPLLPFTFLEGAAAEAFQRRRYELEDVLQDKLTALQYSERMSDVGALLESVITSRLIKSLKEVPLRFFLSYPKSRPQEAATMYGTLFALAVTLECAPASTSASSGRTLTGSAERSVWKERCEKGLRDSGNTARQSEQEADD
jgi:hypothetical protein